MRIGPEAADRLSGGSALIVGGVDPDGAPVATRAWGVTALDDGASLRVYLDADDESVRLHLTDSASVAVTGANVRTLDSVQVKGRVRRVEDLTALDVATCERATELFIQAVQETDGTRRELLESMVPTRFVAMTLVVEELYDQTPGPQAGSHLAPGSP